MPPLLSDELRNQLAESPGRPLEVVDPATQKRYVILDAALFENLRHLLDDDDFDVAETYSAQSTVAGSAGWDDPEMNVYDESPVEGPKS